MCLILWIKFMKICWQKFHVLHYVTNYKYQIELVFLQPIMPLHWSMGCRESGCGFHAGVNFTKAGMEHDATDNAKTDDCHHQKLYIHSMCRGLHLAFASQGYCYRMKQIHLKGCNLCDILLTQCFWVVWLKTYCPFFVHVLYLHLL